MWPLFLTLTMTMVSPGHSTTIALASEANSVIIWNRLRSSSTNNSSNYKPIRLLPPLIKNCLMKNLSIIFNSMSQFAWYDNYYTAIAFSISNLYQSPEQNGRQLYLSGQEYCPFCPQKCTMFIHLVMDFSFHSNAYSATPINETEMGPTQLRCRDYSCFLSWFKI